MLFDEFVKKEVFPYERPVWAGKAPVMQKGAGEEMISDYEMPRFISTPNNVLMRDQFWDTYYKPGPGIPYPVIDSNPSAGKLSPKYWNATDWREFFSPVLLSYMVSKPLGKQNNNLPNIIIFQTSFKHQ